MQVKRHRLLHWLLIITMAMLPLRIALAVNPGCGMHEHGAPSAAHPMHNHSGQMAMNGHAGHRMMNHADPVAGIDHLSYSNADQSTTKHHCCCCDSAKSSCSPDCGMGLHASAIMTSVFSMTNSYQSRTVTVAADVLQTRELTPPSRPPLSFHV
jgi:hypothetical protein